MIAHAAGELIAYLNAAAAKKIGMIERDRALLQSGDSHRHFPGRAWRITALHRTIDERFVGVVKQRGILGAAFFRPDAFRKEVWIKRGRRSKRQNLAVVGIQGDD